MLGSLRLDTVGAGVADDVVPVVGDELVPGQAGVHPGEDHRGGGEDDGVQADRREERGGREVRLLVPGPGGLVYWSPVSDVVVGSQRYHVLTVGFWNSGQSGLGTGGLVDILLNIGELSHSINDRGHSVS